MSPYLRYAGIPKSGFPEIIEEQFVPAHLDLASSSHGAVPILEMEQSCAQQDVYFASLNL